MRYLKTNTATTITVGPFLDKTDGITPETSITVTGVHITFMVDNAGSPTLAVDADATASGGNNDMAHVTNDDAGYYTLELTAANTNYLGGALLSLNVVGTACPVFHEFTILPANIYDSMIAGTDLFDVSTTQFNGSAVTQSGGRPEVNTTHAAGTAWGSGAITAASIADAAIDLATFATDAKALMGVIAFGTLQAVTNTTAQLASGETFADDELIGATILFRTATTGAGQSRVITDSVGATDTVTFDALTTTPTGTVTYVIFSTSPASTSSPIAANVTQFNGVAATSASGIPEVKVASVAANAITATSIASDAITDAKVASDVTIASVTGAVGSVTGNVGGNVVGSVGSVTGLTAANLDATISSRAAASDLATVAGYLDTEIAAIKAKTDNLPASPAAVGSAMTLTSAYDFAKGTTAATESYAADGAAATPVELLYMIWSMLAEKNISSTTLTAKKIDGSTTAMTFTLNDATTPTAITRAT